MAKQNLNLDPSGLLKMPSISRDLGNNLRKVRKLLDLGQEAMAKSLGVHHQTYSRYERGEIIPGAEIFFKIASVFNVNPIFLLTGGGEAFMKADKTLPSGKDPGEKPSSNGDRDLSETKGPLIMKYLTSERAGDSKMASIVMEMVLPWIEMKFGRSAFVGKLEAWIMNADNMAGQIEKGDLLIIDTAFQQVDGSGIYAFNDGRKTIIRRIYERLDGSIYICSDNSRYKEGNLQTPLDSFNDSLISSNGAGHLIMVGKIIKVLKDA